LLERVAKSLSLEVYRETAPQKERSGVREMLVLGGKALVVEVELDMDLEPLDGSESLDESAMASTMERSGTWRIEKLKSALALPTSGDPLPSLELDNFLRPALQAVLDHLPSALNAESHPFSASATETFELQGGRALQEFKRRLREVVELEGVIVGPPGKEESGRGDIFKEGIDVQTQMQAMLTYERIASEFVSIDSVLSIVNV